MKSSEKILIVDDTNVNLTFLSSILDDKGYEVWEASNGEKALSILEKNIPDIILLDIRMPIMDGFEVCKRIKLMEELKEVPVIFISALTELDDKVEGLRLGAVDYVTKPFQREELLVRIRTHLSLREKELKLRKANKKLINYQNTLEEKVKARTKELRETNEKLVKLNSELQEQKNELENTIEKLNTMHAQLIKSDKMASLGVLVAGIAHEINNPVNFTYTSLTGLKNNMKYLDGYIELLDKLNENNYAKIIQGKENKEKEIGIKDLFNMLKKAIEIIEIGIERTTEIVKSLKSFARTDHKQLKAFDINENLDNTLIILQNLYKNRIEIIKKYDDIPKIYCFPSQINQVFMNLLSNAIQAIQGKGKIWIATALKNKEEVIIKIKDTGEGISEKVQKHIFDSFYTTKKTGKGTGLGLSISNSIIKAHRGTINLKSEVGKGSSFEIVLPLEQQKADNNLE